MKKLFFTLLSLCLFGTMWADTIGNDIQKDATTGLYFATVTYDNANTSSVIAIIPAQNGESYSVDNLVQNSDGTYTLPATVQAEGGNAVALQGVAASTFASVLTNTSNLIHLVIPANIIEIGQSAFQSCTQIGEVTVEYSETDLDEAHNVTYGNSFSGCSNLKVVTQNRNIDVHRNNNQYAYICFPFADLPSIETVNIGEKVTALSNNAYNARSANTKLTAVYCYATTVPTLDYQCFLYRADGCKLYVYDDLLDYFKSDSQYNSDYSMYHGWADIFGADNIVGMGEEPEEEQPEGTLRDVTTGLYFEISDGVTSIVKDASGTYTDDNLLYNEEGDYYTFPETVTDKSGTSGSVTRIGESAFQGSLISGHIYIPAFVTALGKQAFYGVTTITEVTFEYSATPIKEENNNNWYTSFYNCSGIKTVHLNRDVSTARGYKGDLDYSGNNLYRICPFSELTSIETIYIGENVTVIPYSMFNCNAVSSCALKEVYCYALEPPTLQYKAFGDHTDLTLYVYDNVKEAYENYEAASGYESWTTFFSTYEDIVEDLDGALKDVATGLYFEFYEMTDGTSVVSIIPDPEMGGVYTDANLIYNEEGDYYTFPAQVSADGETYYDLQRIGESAFEDAGLTGHIYIPATINYIAMRAFYDNTGITEVTYEYSETALSDEDGTNTGDYSFGGCTGVKTVNLYRDINLGSSSRHVGPFEYDGSIETVNIGPRVTVVPNFMFRNTSTYSLTTVNCYPLTVPTTNYDPFGNFTNCTLYVPFGLKDTYAEATYAGRSYVDSDGNPTTTWGTFFTEIKDMSDAFAITTNEGEDGAYATFYNSASAVEFFNAEATVYAATSVKIEDGDGNVYINDLGSVVPKATAVLVETSEAQTMLAIATTEEVTAPTTNYLYGYDTATEITEPADCVYYMLTYGANGGSLGFYWGVDGGGAFTSAAHKAYLAIPSDIANKASGISIKKDADGDTTGISSVEANEGAKVSGIYTIQGVRVSSMSQPGLYIVDGKKVLVK